MSKERREEGGQEQQKEYRIVECPKCSQKLRLAVSPKNFGKEVRATCSICKDSFNTTIAASEIEEVVAEPVIDEVAEAEKSQLEALQKEFFGALTEAISESPRLKEASGKYKEAGYDLACILSVMIRATKSDREEGAGSADLKPVVKLVQDGEIVSGVYSEQDEKWLNDMNRGFQD